MSRGKYRRKPSPWPHLASGTLKQPRDGQRALVAHRINSMEYHDEFQPLTTEPDIFVTIRFSASVPDILLEVSHPSTTTSAGLRQLIREKLPKDLAKRKLRLIYAGRALIDGVGLGVSLRLELDPVDVKGKKPIRGNDDELSKRVYIHCSIGEIVLSEEELANEAQESHIFSTVSEEDSNAEPDHSTLAGRQDSPQAQNDSSTTTPAPRGFDRLISAGFTAAEVSTLRSQFLALQSLTHTPDTMPSGEELRRLEDRWMDEGSTEALPGGGDGGGIVGGGAFGNLSSDGTGVLDDMLWGSMMGFFWPVGCGLWLLREEGVWSWRKGLAVFVGVVMNFGLGVVKWLN
ncbi:hypothetical protein LOZ04_001554 [Ophidiomyces ophidiicola]|uniref:uncharacterized protein n=1 Tax=Ophidiomyces ophidiicola TaxID=1387563 RepID=UPI0020C56B3F|nr:uncharacterized protein LOZ57_004587 [Ophidiomyces ophidiicola]KAI1944914.1 hypothetical protein LOZ57_004587 [Ophidiomyces ophidiicola]KAI1952410.1 hypothetical protein LOZ62_001359 [Ophidiomyces ophidiicola]KAI2007457.1 hypothetical protein LOZ50_002557 [Ophidiomyces ophidiicola]KAI2011932.1 hypothetical protein LOZ49_002878 [Ophidiomyces ophidiicola]KAI2019509.1 hypothetical protein LOZ46_003334 [Ophidiomyces ophidiicola]